MNSLFSNLLADISSLPWVAIIAIIGGFCIGPIIVFFVFRFAQRRHELWHETARIALEKGQPLPPLPHDLRPSSSSGAAQESNDLRTGLVLVATGAGLYFFFVHFLPWLAYVGAIPGFIGVALVLYAILSTVIKRKDTPPADRP